MIYHKHSSHINIKGFIGKKYIDVKFFEVGTCLLLYEKKKIKISWKYVNVIMREQVIISCLNKKKHHFNVYFWLLS